MGLTRYYIKSWLEENGYDPSVDEDGDLIFKIEEKTYCIEHKEEDETFYRIIFPNFWSIESEEERRKVENASAAATAQIKVAKVFPVKNDTWASVELFCADVDSFLNVLDRSFGALQAAVSTFVDKMRLETAPPSHPVLGPSEESLGETSVSSDSEDGPDDDFLDIFLKRM